MRLVLDTDVVVRALRSPAGSSADILRRLRHRRFVAVVSVPLFVEYEAVLTRPEHLLATRLTAREMSQFLDALALLVEPIQITYLWRPQLKDAADEMVLEAAVNGRAEAIVTFNQRDFTSAADSFSIEVLLPREAIGRIDQ